MRTRKIEIEVPADEIRISEVPDVYAKLTGTEPVTRQAVYLWIQEGKLNAKGETVHLDTKISAKGGHMVTTTGMIQDFIRRLN